MSDTVGTFWIVTGQNDEFTFGSNPRPASRTFSFTLTEENYNSWGYITLMAKGVSFDHNRVLLNGHFVGHLNPTSGGYWSQQTFIIEVYDEQLFGDGPPNNLVIESKNSTGGDDGNLDDFEIKHVIFHYRTNR